MPRLAVLVLVFSPTLLLLASAPPRPAVAPVFRLDQRIPVTTSRVVGSPDPPPPYRNRRVFEKLAGLNKVEVE